MGYNQRERERKAKAAKAAAQATARRSGGTTGGRWLTPVTRDTCCASCGTPLRAGRHEMVYRHTPRESLCVPCATAARIFYRPSLAWHAAAGSTTPPGPSAGLFKQVVADLERRAH